MRLLLPPVHGVNTLVRISSCESRMCFRARVPGWGLRESHVWKEFLEEFKGGEVTIAVANYPMNDWYPTWYIPATGPFRVWIEEQKLPPLGE